MCLDVAGLAANLYRRNTPIIKVLPRVRYPRALTLLPGHTDLRRDSGDEGPAI